MKYHTVCIDESGITSKGGHSTFAFVYIETENIKELNKKIEIIEREFGISFIHWSEMSWKRRSAVATSITSLDFDCRVAVLRDKSLSGKNIKTIDDKKFPALRLADFIAGAT